MLGCCSRGYLEQTLRLVDKCQEQFPATQQEELFHNFQLPDQISLFHDQLPELLKKKTTYFQLSMMVKHTWFPKTTKFVCLPREKTSWDLGVKQPRLVWFKVNCAFKRTHASPRPVKQLSTHGSHRYGHAAEQISALAADNKKAVSRKFALPRRALRTANVCPWEMITVKF